MNYRTAFFSYLQTLGLSAACLVFLGTAGCSTEMIEGDRGALRGAETSDAEDASQLSYVSLGDACTDDDASFGCFDSASGCLCPDEGDTAESEAVETDSLAEALYHYGHDHGDPAELPNGCKYRCGCGRTDQGLGGHYFGCSGAYIDCGNATSVSATPSNDR